MRQRHQTFIRPVLTSLCSLLCILFPIQVPTEAQETKSEVKRVATNLPPASPNLIAPSGQAIGNNTLTGGPGEDTLLGQDGNDQLEGGDGEDTLEGREGDDTLYGGAGKDWLFGGDGNDRLLGGAGDDILMGDDGNDDLNGGEDNDLLEGGPGEDKLDGGAGADRMDGEAGNDTLMGGSGDDVLDGGDGSDTLLGGEGNDDLDGGDEVDLLDGGPGDDKLAGGDGRDTLIGGAGDDILRGGDGDDVLLGGLGADWLFGGDGSDTLDGGLGDDTLIGWDGNDKLSGDLGSDILRAGAGNDYLFGGNNNDVLLGEGGEDLLAGDNGDDTLLGGAGQDTVKGGAGEDLIILRKGDVDPDRDEIIDGGDGVDTLILNGFRQSDISGFSVPSAETSQDPSTSKSTPFSISDPLTGGTYTVSNLEKILHSHVFTQISQGANLPTLFLFTNPSGTESANGRIDFYARDGEPLSLSINGNAEQTSFEFSIPPLGSSQLRTDGQGEAVSGAAQVYVDRPLGGVVSSVFGEMGRAGAVESPMMDGFMLPVTLQRSTNVSTGFAVTNVGLEGTLQLTLYNLQGVELESTAIDVPANGQLVGFVHQLFPEFTDFEGTLRSATGVGEGAASWGMAAVGIQTASQPGQMSTFPVTPVVPQQLAQLISNPPGSEEPKPVGQTLYFPQFGKSENFVSSLFLINPSLTEEAKGTLAFFDEEGRSLAIAVNDQPPSSEIPFDIAPSGGAVFQTDPQGLLALGSAQAILTEGLIGGVLHFEYSGGARVGLGPSEPLSGLISLVRRDTVSGLNTQLAIGSTGSEVTLELKLRTANGDEVPGGTARFQLPANGHLAGLINELFPEADTTDLQGTLTVSAVGGEVAVSALQMGSQPDQLMALPVAPLQ